MRKISSHISLLLLVVFGFIITPKEMIHECYGHDDTHCSPGRAMTLEVHHHHCDILQIASLVYTSPFKIALHAIRFAKTPVFSVAFLITPVPFLLFFNLRAPPLSFFH